MSKFTRKFTPSIATTPEWLVLVGEDLTEHWVRTQTPDEQTVRKLLSVRESVPIVIGRP